MTINLIFESFKKYGIAEGKVFAVPFTIGMKGIEAKNKRYNIVICIRNSAREPRKRWEYWELGLDRRATCTLTLDMVMGDKKLLANSIEEYYADKSPAAAT